jgi:peptidoglycan/LPS O-acetylase OafA/YrhL
LPDDPTRHPAAGSQNPGLLSASTTAHRSTSEAGARSVSTRVVAPATHELAVPVAPVVAPPPGHPRFRLLDSLRAIAALGVLFGHVAGASHITVSHWWSPLVASGNQGVTVFFILSGFLLYRPMVSAQFHGAPRPAWRDYARRRLLRIVPAYWLALTVLAIYPGLPGVFTHNWWYYYFFLQVYNHDVSIGGIIVAWSLCIEVSFYLLLPLYADLIARVTRGVHITTRVRVELAILSSLAVASLALRYVDPTFPLALPIYFQWFAEGMGLALVSAALQGRSPALAPRAVRVVSQRPGLCWGVALVLYVLLCFGLGKPPAAGYPDLKEVLLNRLLGGVMALFLVLPAVFGDTEGGWPRRLLAWPLLAWTGLISYGIYLWHLNVLEQVAGHVQVHGNNGVAGFIGLAILTLAGTAAVAAASYYIVERPLLRFKFRRGAAPRAADGG